ncbi:MAG: YD repeat-containing protein, partial [Phenylobacterium sp.]
MIIRHRFLALVLFFAFGTVEAVEAKVEVSIEAGAVYLPLPPSQVSALEEIYIATEGANWHSNANWSSKDPCRWYGVHCLQKKVPGASDTTYQLHVSQLNLSSNNLIGTIPVSINALEELTKIDLSHNQLNGSIPATLSLLDKLASIDLAANALSGSIPTSLGFLAELTTLSLHNNQLSGEIPVSIGSLAKLTQLHLHSNKLTGSIPKTIAQLIHLKELLLMSNQLTGNIPSEIGNMGRLEAIYLSRNKLTGSIPNSLTQLGNLRKLYLSDNQLEGNIPDSIGTLVQLEHLQLNGNDLDGTMPNSIGDLSQLQILKLSDNRLNGSIPEVIGNLTNLTTLTLSSNLFSGDIPTAIDKLTSLTILHLSHNKITGVIPESIGNLTQLNSLMLDNNQLTGTLPKSLGNLDKLALFWATSNQLTGITPPSLYALANSNKSLFYLNFNEDLGAPLSPSFLTEYPWLAEQFLEKSERITHFGQRNCYPDTNHFTTRFDGAENWLRYTCTTQNQSCPEQNTGPACMAGNPINLRTGVKQQTVIDFRSTGPSPLQLIRRYNSVNRDWSFNLQPYQLLEDDVYVRVKRTNNKSYLFYCNATTDSCNRKYSVGETTIARGYRLEKLATSYQFTLPSGATETYNTDGQMVESTSSQGQTLSYSYQANIITIDNAFNQHITLTLSDNRISQATTPLGVFGYDYNAAGLLSTVTKPDNSTVDYYYDEQTYSNAEPGAGLLTGHSDGKGQRAASWYYDNQARAYKSEHGEGVDTTQIRFISESGDTVIDADNNATLQQRVREVINPLGQRTRTTFVAPADQQAEKIEYFNNQDTLTATEFYQYDDIGYLAQSSDKQGLITQFSRDIKGRELTRIEYA